MFKKQHLVTLKLMYTVWKKAPTSIKKVWELSEISSTATFATIKSQHKLLTKNYINHSHHPMQTFTTNCKKFTLWNCASRHNCTPHLWSVQLYSTYKWTYKLQEHLWQNSTIIHISKQSLECLETIPYF